jgi:hypothetical protein
MTMRWLPLWIAVAACVVAFSWPRFATPALALALVCGLIGLGHLVVRRGPTGPTDQRGGDPRDGGSLPQPSREADVEFRDRGQRFGPS